MLMQALNCLIERTAQSSRTTATRTGVNPRRYDIVLRLRICERCRGYPAGDIESSNCWHVDVMHVRMLCASGRTRPRAQRPRHKQTVRLNRLQDHNARNVALNDLPEGVMH